LVDGIGQEAVGRLGCGGQQARTLSAEIAGGEGFAPGAESGQPAQLSGTLETFEAQRLGRVTEQLGLDGEEKRREGFGLDNRDVVPPAPQADRVAAGSEPRRQDARCGVPPEEQRGPLQRQQ
jgi:hypothetical protein